MQIKVLHNQTLLDISIYLFGTAVGAMSLAFANDISLTDDLEVGTVLNVPENSDFGQRLIAEYFQNKSLKPATKIVGKILESIPVDFGIGEMIIEESFIIR
ncbi:hypothetical protein OBK30_01865 [Empedobacter falsenii]